MIGCLWTRVRKQPMIVLYFEFENELKFYNLEARSLNYKTWVHSQTQNKVQWLAACGQASDGIFVLSFEDKKWRSAILSKKIVPFAWRVYIDN